MSKKVQDGMAAQLGKQATSLGMAGVFILVGVVFVWVNWDNIGTIFKSTENIEHNTIFRAEQKQVNADIRADQDKINRNLEGRIITLESKLSIVEKASDKLESIDLSLNKLVNDFESVRNSALKAESKVEDIDTKISGIERKEVELEKELSTLAGELKQAQKEIKNNSDFTSKQPQRAATRIEQLKTLIEHKEYTSSELLRLRDDITYFKATHRHK